MRQIILLMPSAGAFHVLVIFAKRLRADGARCIQLGFERAQRGLLVASGRSRHRPPDRCGAHHAEAATRARYLAGAQCCRRCADAGDTRRHRLCLWLSRRRPRTLRGHAARQCFRAGLSGAAFGARHVGALGSVVALAHLAKDHAGLRILIAKEHGHWWCGRSRIGLHHVCRHGRSARCWCSTPAC